MKDTLKLALLERIIADLRQSKSIDYAVVTYDQIVAFERNADGAVVVPLTQGQFALIDPEDEERVRQYKWFAIRDVNKRGCFYARAKIEGRAVPLHRFILEVQDPKVIVDHKDHNTLNCRRDNLRQVDRFQSAQNRRSWTSSKRTHQHGSCFKGVYAVVNSKGEVTAWRSVIKARKKLYELGRFNTEKEAALAYNAKAMELHGEYAKLNVIQDA